MENVLIIGQGNIGTMVGAKLKAAGYSVDHYVRNKHKSRSAIRLKITDFTSGVKLAKKENYIYKNVYDIRLIKNYNYVFVSVPQFQLREVIIDISPFLKKSQKVVIMGNVWNDFNFIESNLNCIYFFAFPNFAGVVKNDILVGVLTRKFTTGFTNYTYSKEQIKFDQLLTSIGFKPQQKQMNIAGWLLVHYAFMGSIMTVAAKEDSFVKMTSKFKSIKDIFLLMKEYMAVVEYYNIDLKKFNESKTIYNSLWYNTLKFYLIFRVPGLARKVNLLKDINVWTSFIKTFNLEVEDRRLDLPLIKKYYSYFVN